MKGTLMMTLLVWVAASAGGAAAQGVTCGSGEWAGAEGAAACSAVAPGYCSFAAPAALSTVRAPALLEGEAAGGGMLTIQMRHGLVSGRRVTGVALSGSAACNYPGPNWVKGVGAGDDACLDVYNATIPWASAWNGTSGADQSASGCGLTRIDSDPLFLVFEGAARVTMEEPLAAQRGAGLTRTITSVLKFRVKFPRRASVSAGVAVFADPRLLSAVTQQEWRPASYDGLLGLTTSLQHPFRVAGLTVPGAPAGVTPSVVGAPLSDCAPGAGEACGQLFTVALAPGAGVCRLDGVYAVRLELACHEGVTGAACPLTGAGEGARFVTLNVSLSSEDFCAVVEEVVGVELALSSHASFAPALFDFGAPKGAFFQDQAIYWRLECASTDGFALAATTLEEVRATLASGAEATVFAAGGAPPAAGWAFGTSFDAAGAGTLAHEHEFHFTPAASVFGAVAEDGSSVSTVTAVVSVVFANTGARKRFVLQADAAAPETAEASARARLAPADAALAGAGARRDAPVPEEDATSGAAPTSAVGAALATLLLAAVLVA